MFFESNKVKTAGEFTNTTLRMTPSDSTAIDVIQDTPELVRHTEGKEPTAVFDDRGRSVAWMTRTLYRLYEDQAQRSLRENVC